MRLMDQTRPHNEIRKYYENIGGMKIFRKITNEEYSESAIRSWIYDYAIPGPLAAKKLHEYTNGQISKYITRPDIFDEKP